MGVKCPTDGEEMKQCQVVGIDNSLRCEKCGGCWVEGWVINSLAEGKEIKINSYQEAEIFGEGEVRCPEDASKMGIGGGNDLPEGVNAWKCEKCKKWWLPGNSIFDLAAAFAVKKEYLKTWKRRSDTSVYALPVILTLVMVFGMGVILRQIHLRQLWQTQAAIVRNSTVRYLGESKAEIKMLVSGDLGVVEYRLEGEPDWEQAPVVSQGEWQVAVIEGIQPGQKFLLKWNRGIVQMQVGEVE